MDNRNMSDIIESYIKEILEIDKMIEIRRSEMADLFECVPSQINYVIKTRFTVPQGYQVESKRGGGGYIRIVKVDLLQHGNYLLRVAESVGSSLTESEAFAILKQLQDNEVIDVRENNIISALLCNKPLLSVSDNSKLRAHMMIELLERLTYDEKE
ncbi:MULTISPECIES: CtsR family transcriptional regulator [Vagococcus]|uniref:Transcriptional regulator CtsR n=1 Tax=Vagococcus fluvialis bH819 TaxID=1255619 RepID=A0A1X6WKV1_9ENTE|nr:MULTISPECIES: CtsR family transcriptional regulator [Vagococcus]SLM84961.1 Transcriptional regulator CtsR [Vagococcus fluvialis bH819]HCM88622.1 CtsR family transcriptional regulator [Vagococcus sp.]